MLPRRELTALSWLLALLVGVHTLQICLWIGAPQRSEPYPDWLIYIGLIPESYSDLTIVIDEHGVPRPRVIHTVRWFWQ